MDLIFIIIPPRDVISVDASFITGSGYIIISTPRRRASALAAGVALTLSLSILSYLSVID